MSNSVLAAVHAAAQQTVTPEASQNSEQPVATPAVDINAIRAEGHAEGVKAERDRCRSILTCEAAKTRPTLASHLAFETELAADTASALLTTAAQEAGQSRLDGAVPQPNIAAEAPSERAESDPASQLMAAIDRARGISA